MKIFKKLIPFIILLLAISTISFSNTEFGKGVGFILAFVYYVFYMIDIIILIVLMLSKYRINELLSASLGLINLFFLIIGFFLISSYSINNTILLYYIYAFFTVYFFYCLLKRNKENQPN